MWGEKASGFGCWVRLELGLRAGAWEALLKCSCPACPFPSNGVAGPREIGAIQSPSSCSQTGGCRLWTGGSLCAPHHPAAAPTTGQLILSSNCDASVSLLLWVIPKEYDLVWPSQPPGLGCLSPHFPSQHAVLSGHPVLSCGVRL